MQTFYKKTNKQFSVFATTLSKWFLKILVYLKFSIFQLSFWVCAWRFTTTYSQYITEMCTTQGPARKSGETTWDIQYMCTAVRTHMYAGFLVSVLSLCLLIMSNLNKTFLRKKSTKWHVLWSYSVYSTISFMIAKLHHHYLSHI